MKNTVSLWDRIEPYVRSSTVLDGEACPATCWEVISRIEVVPLIATEGQPVSAWLIGHSLGDHSGVRVRDLEGLLVAGWTRRKPRRDAVAKQRGGRI